MNCKTHIMTSSSIAIYQAHKPRFHNVPCPDNRNVHKQNTGQFVLDICDNYFKTPISLNELDRTHPIGKVRDGKVQVKVGLLLFVNDRSCIVQKVSLKTTLQKLHCHIQNIY